MRNDIDHIIAEVRLRVPSVVVDQLPKMNPGDDDGIWDFRNPNDEKFISLESSFGKCPFLVEHSDSPAPAECADWAPTIEDAIEKVVSYLNERKAGSRRA